MQSRIGRPLALTLRSVRAGLGTQNPGWFASSTFHPVTHVLLLPQGQRYTTNYRYPLLYRA